VPAPPKPKGSGEENPALISPKPREPVKPLFDPDNLDHRKIRAAIHLQNNYGINVRIGARDSSGLVIMPRRDGPELTREDLVKVKELDLSGKGLSDLSPLAGLTGTKSLYLNNNPGSDIAPLSGLKGLWALSLSRCRIVSLTPLRNLNGLVYLNLDHNQIRDLTPVAGLKGLEIFGLSGNQILDLTPLAGLKKLYHLELVGNRITDLSPLANLISLKYLSLDNNPSLTKAEIQKLQKALPRCEISHNATK
jgi:Leucine-rich repeat (LRR) protein